MTLNRAAHEALGKPVAVRFFFDETLKRIGLTETSIENRYAFPLKQRDNHSYRFIHTGAFCSHFGINPEATMQFNDVTIDKEGIMTLELAKATKITRGAR
jgi:hypothetical protein